MYGKIQEFKRYFLKVGHGKYLCYTGVENFKRKSVDHNALFQAEEVIRAIAARQTNTWDGQKKKRASKPVWLESE